MLTFNHVIHAARASRTFTYTSGLMALLVGAGCESGPSHPPLRDEADEQDASSTSAHPPLPGDGGRPHDAGRSSDDSGQSSVTSSTLPSASGRDADAPSADEGTASSLPDASVPAPDSDAAAIVKGEKCGDGVVNDEGEGCDGSDLGGQSCAVLGFAEGELTCDEFCGLDLSGCTGVELCYDGADNDGDGLIDCGDEEDCAEVCASSCEGAIELEPLQFAGDAAPWLDGDTRGRANELDASCGTSSSGPEVVYQVVPTLSGVLEVELESLDLLTVSVKEGCEGVSPRDDLACVLAGRSLRLSTVAGEPLYVVVDGRSEDDEGAFRVRISEHEQLCGDASRDEPEECDDGNLVESDGCDAECKLEATEVEPNDELDLATKYDAPFFGEISGPTDLDYVALDLSLQSQSVRIFTRDLGDGACELLMDTFVTLVDDNGETLATDDDGGAGLCSGLALSELPAGRYYLVVSGVEGSGATSFPYRLDVEVSAE